MAARIHRPCLVLLLLLMIPTSAPAEERKPADPKAPPEKEKEPEPPRPTAEEVDGLLKDWEKRLARPGMGDRADVIRDLKRLSGWAEDPKLDAALRKKATAAVAAAALVGARDVAIQAVRLLGGLGRAGVAGLRAAVSRHLEEKDGHEEVGAEGLVALGRVASTDPADVKFLLKRLEGPRGTVVLAAVRAVGGYENSARALRLDLFRAVLLAFEASTALGGPVYGSPAQQLEVAKEMDRILTVLSGTVVPFPPVVEWRKWLNEKGKDLRNWPEREGDRR